MSSGAAHEARSVGSEHETDEEDDDDYVEALPLASINKNRKARTSVSAEAYGAWNKKSDFQPRVIQKSEETKAKICARLKQSFLFQSLNPKEF